MDAQQIMETAEFKRCEEFHGHVCPGLSIGFRAAQAAIQKLRENRTQDEAVVTVVENDACYADAVQVLTGCTFCKGNFNSFINNLSRLPCLIGAVSGLNPACIAVAMVCSNSV